MKVYNKHHGNAPADAKYIGRGSPYGNPYNMKDGLTRDQVCDLYEQNVLPTLNLKDLVGKDLICFCAPKRCHGDSIIREIEKRYGKTLPGN